MALRNTKKITIHICLLLTLFFEIVVATLVYNEIGNGRVTISIFRLIIQLILLVGILLSNSRIPIYIITFYHVIIGLVFLVNDVTVTNVAFGLYHFVIGLMIYFYEEIDLKLKKLLS